MSKRDENKLRVLELYSGIGGMHWALKESGVPFEVVMAVDINTTANKIYEHNFPEVNLNSFGIEKLSLKKLRSLRPNAILMSPPCQPFSRVGKKGDCDDVRTKSFLHVLQLLQQIEVKPHYILVENVKGFETSRTRQLLLDTLNTCDYAYQEYLLTPLQFGIPNSRLRYFMIAKLKGCLPSLSQTSEILYSLSDSKHTKDLTGDQECPEDDPISSPPATSHNDRIHTCCTCSGKCQNPLSGAKSNTRQNCVKDSNKSEDTLPQDLNAVKSHSSSSSGQGRSSVNYRAKPELVSDSCDDSGDIEPMKKSLCLEKDGVSNAVSQSTENETSCYDVSDSREQNSTNVQKLNGLFDAGRNMRFCEESDSLITEESRPLSDFMEEGGEEDFEYLLVADKDLRQFVVMDIVLPDLKKSTCFAKRYGHYIEGGGSLVQMSSSTEDTCAASAFKSKAVELKNKHDWGEDELSIVRRLKLRYFSPREVSNLLCFPKEFDFPEGVSNIQKYRVLGNSLNVHIVARLIKHLTANNIR